MLLRGSRRGLLNLGSLLMAVVLCDVGSRRAPASDNRTGAYFDLGVPESCGTSCMRCCPRAAWQASHSAQTPGALPVSSVSTPPPSTREDVLRRSNIEF